MHSITSRLNAKSFLQLLYLLLAFILFISSLPLIRKSLTFHKIDSPIKALNKAQIVTEYGRLPMSFEINKGQVDKQVQFLSRGNGYTLFLTSTGAVLSLQKQLGETASVKMQLVGANPSPKIAGKNKQLGKVNYLVGNNSSTWETGVSTFSKVKYENIYPGINLIYYGNQSQLEYDFVVSPGADPNDITLNFAGAEKIEIDSNANLILYIAGEKVILHKPNIRQEINGKKNSIDGGYILSKNNQVRFHVDPYDSGRSLVIDPVLIYSTYLGGSGQEVGRGITVDSAGNVYITGITTSVDFPVKNAYQSTWQHITDVPRTDVFVTKLNSDGTSIVYSTYLGGNGEDSGESIAVDTNHNAYVTGGTNSTNFPTINAVQPDWAVSNTCAVRTTPSGLYAEPCPDAFVTKLSVDGASLVYSTYLGGNAPEPKVINPIWGADAGRSIAVDPAGNAYVTGNSHSPLNFPIVNALQPEIRDSQDDHYGQYGEAFVAKFTPAGALIYSTFLGGHSNDGGRGIATDASGNAYVAGSTSSSNFPVFNPLQDCNHGGAFVSKINSVGSSLIYSTCLGHDSGATSIAVDTVGNTYITGGTSSTDFPTINATQPQIGGGNANFGGDGFVTKLNANGSALVYSTYLGGSHSDAGHTISVDSLGNAFISGETSSDDFPTKSPLQWNFGGEIDAFVTMISSTGNLDYSTFLGGSKTDIGEAIATNIDSTVYLVGQTNSNDYFTVNSLQPTLASIEADSFVTKIDFTAKCQDRFLVNNFTTDADFNPITSFDVLFTPDQTSSGMKLKSTNPGSYFYNSTIQNISNENRNYTLILNLPTTTTKKDGSTINAFNLKGGNPIQIFSNLARTTDITSSATIMRSIDDRKIFITAPIESGGLIYLTVHLDFGLKDDTGYSEEDKISYVNGFTFRINVRDNSICSNSNASAITAAGKNVTGLGGFVFDTSGNPKGGLVAKLFDQNDVEMMQTVPSDGFYFLQTPGAGTYKVKIFDSSDNVKSVSQPETLADKEFRVVDFTNINPADPLIYGFVKDVKSQGISGVKVELYNVADKLVASTKTSASGNYSFRFSAPGKYIVKLTVPNNYKANEDSKNVTVGQFDEKRIDFTLSSN